MQSGWNNIGVGHHVAIGANGDMFALGTNTVGTGRDYGIHKWNGAKWLKFAGGGVRIAVDPYGNPWVVNGANNIYRWSNGWQVLPGLAKDISVGANGEVFVIGTDGDEDHGIYKWNGLGWVPFGGGGRRIAVDPYGTPWVVNSHNKIYRWDKGNWQPTPSWGTAIAIGANGDVLVLSTTTVGPTYDQVINKWNGSDWVPFGGGGGGVQIAVDPNGNPAIVNYTNQIWLYKP